MTAAADTGIRVLLVDDQELVRSGLRRILRRRDGFVIAGECGDGAEVPAALAAHDVDVVVMDLRMKDVDGIEAIRRLRQSGAHPPVLALTTFDDDELLAGALRAGAVGYVLKDSSAEDLIRAVRAVAAGDAWLDTAVIARVLTTYRQAANDHLTGPSSGLLTPGEHDVLRAIGRGLSNAEIATTLVISEVTVKSHIGRIFTKLGLRDRAAAVVYAFDHGIVIPGQDIGSSGNGRVPGAEESAQEPKTTFGEPLPVVRSTAAPGADRKLQISVLGPVRAWLGGAELDLGPIRQQALLVALVLRPDVTISQRELVPAVWEAERPNGNSVAVYVYRLRRCLQADDGASASVIVSDRGGYRFVGEGVSVDAVRLEEIANEADAVERSGDLAAAVSACSRALDLFQGEPLAELPGRFAAGERRRLTERRMALSLQKLDWQIRLRRHTDTLGELSALNQEHPYNEPVTALLMRALYASDRRADALDVYTEIRRRLVSDLGMEPDDELRRIHQAILRGDKESLGLAPG